MRALACAALALLATLSPAAHATYACNVSADGSINFLTYDPFGPDTTASAAVTLTCNHTGGGNDFITWRMNLSNGSSGNCSNRQMQRQTAPAASISYNIFQNSTTTVWGNLSCGTSPSGQLQVNNGNRVNGTTQTMRGVLPAGQSVPFGSYLDTLILTVSF